MLARLKEGLQARPRPALFSPSWPRPGVGAPTSGAALTRLRAARRTCPSAAPTSAGGSPCPGTRSTSSTSGADPGNPPPLAPELAAPDSLPPDSGLPTPVSFPQDRRPLQLRHRPRPRGARERPRREALRLLAGVGARDGAPPARAALSPLSHAPSPPQPRPAPDTPRWRPSPPYPVCSSNLNNLQAKEISWFHAVIWPALLMALDLPLPNKARPAARRRGPPPPRSPLLPLSAPPSPPSPPSRHGKKGTGGSALRRRRRLSPTIRCTRTPSGSATGRR